MTSIPDLNETICSLMLCLIFSAQIVLSQNSRKRRNSLIRFQRVTWHLTTSFLRGKNVDKRFCVFSQGHVAEMPHFSPEQSGVYFSSLSLYASHGDSSSVSKIEKKKRETSKHFIKQLLWATYWTKQKVFKEGQKRVASIKNMWVSGYLAVE